MMMLYRMDLITFEQAKIIADLVSGILAAAEILGLERLKTIETRLEQRIFSLTNKIKEKFNHIKQLLTSESSGTILLGWTYPIFSILIGLACIISVLLPITGLGSDATPRSIDELPIWQTIFIVIASLISLIFLLSGTSMLFGALILLTLPTIGFILYILFLLFVILFYVLAWCLSLPVQISVSLRERFQLKAAIPVLGLILFCLTRAFEFLLTLE